MPIAPVPLAACIALAGFTLAVRSSSHSNAEVLGVTLSPPFQGTDSSVSGTAPPYSPYVGRSDKPHPVTPETVEAYLAARGFTGISNLERRGGSYICEATGPRRERVRLVVDASSGDISGMQVIGFGDKRY
ncbi:hypothetical protein [Aquabacter spiritensis]|uniref:YpeB-like protein with protease inhibitory function n=1 Tax=Aquabacter spiritensis TaxID=933073 RepID=A0A4V2UY72_9HYPH|nr:hypothetical protein [Aquabacter spiritensis]TCT06258.1 hypothetical protein EDC64_103362 [Aquabacter spiritensis]